MPAAQTARAAGIGLASPMFLTPPAKMKACAEGALVETFFLCDLSHTSQGINSEFIPYPIGCIKSYFDAHSGAESGVQLFKYPERFLEALDQTLPAIVGFSNYMWNLELGLSLAVETKRRSPDTLIVFGGPNYPLESERQGAWLRARPVVDLYLIGEGERPFTEVALAWLETRSIDEVKRRGIAGAHALIDDVLFKANAARRDGYDDAPRVADLDETPSPYLMGYLDEFLADSKLVPMMESNRGCPFRCSYCVDGIAARSKVNKAPLERLVAELEYIAKRHEGRYLTLADTNFGMYKGDVAFCGAIARVRERYDYPHHLQVSTGKNQKARIIHCAELLDGALRFSGSVQSLDPEVLSNVNRNNISFEELLDTSARMSQTKASTYSEVILGLPGDTREKHLMSVSKLVDAGFNQIRLYTLMLLEGSDLTTAASRARFGLRGRFRVVPRSFGAYATERGDLRSVEIEEVCVESDSMSFDDYLDCRRFALTVTLFYNDNVFFELGQLIRSRAHKVSDWLRFVHERSDRFPRALADVYARFDAETREELWSSEAQLRRVITEDPKELERYIRGDAGNNVLFNCQALAHTTAIEAMHDAAFSAAAEFLGFDAKPADSIECAYLEDLRRYSLARKRGFLDLDAEEDAVFGFDFLALERQAFECVPRNRRTTEVRFRFEPWQKDFIGHQLSVNGRTLQGLGKIFSRVPIKKLQRVPEAPPTRSGE